VSTNAHLKRYNVYTRATFYIGGVMRIIFHSFLLLSLLSIAGCGSRHHQVIIDPKGVDMGQYQQDLNSCTQIAQQVEQKAGEGAVTGAVIGGVIGAVVGNSRTVQKVAGVGAVKGGVGGAMQTNKEKKRVVKNCMRGRGYKVLN